MQSPPRRSARRLDEALTASARLRIHRASTTGSSRRKSPITIGCVDGDSGGFQIDCHPTGQIDGGGVTVSSSIRDGGIWRSGRHKSIDNLPQVGAIANPLGSWTRWRILLGRTRGPEQLQGSSRSKERTI